MSEPPSNALVEDEEMLTMSCWTEIVPSPVDTSDAWASVCDLSVGDWNRLICRLYAGERLHMAERSFLADLLTGNDAEYELKRRNGHRKYTPDALRNKARLGALVHEHITTGKMAKMKAYLAAFSEVYPERDFRAADAKEAYEEFCWMLYKLEKLETRD